MSERMCFVKDDSGHWFCILVSQKRRFYELLETIGMGEDTPETWEQFSEFDADRLAMHISNYSFTNLKEISR